MTRGTISTIVPFGAARQRSSNSPFISATRRAVIRCLLATSGPIDISTNVVRGALAIFRDVYRLRAN
jgi:hypothetical protein